MGTSFQICKFGFQLFYFCKNIFYAAVNSRQNYTAQNEYARFRSIIFNLRYLFEDLKYYTAYYVSSFKQDVAQLTAVAAYVRQSHSEFCKYFID